MCVTCKLQSGKMKSQKVLNLLLLYNVLETVYRVVQAGDGRTHAFVHVDGDLRYLMDGVSMEMQEKIPEGSELAKMVAKNDANLTLPPRFCHVLIESPL
ncbi:uncharacterized protein TNCV_688581 [Trichonephila clavipes]|nr:uncharacterized protein TNCV_688581 [Trichonephila clavipes]